MNNANWIWLLMLVPFAIVIAIMRDAYKYRRWEDARMDKKDHYAWSKGGAIAMIAVMAWITFFALVMSFGPESKLRYLAMAPIVLMVVAYVIMMMGAGMTAVLAIILSPYFFVKVVVEAIKTRGRNIFEDDQESVYVFIFSGLLILIAYKTENQPFMAAVIVFHWLSALLFFLCNARIRWIQERKQELYDYLYNR